MILQLITNEGIVIAELFNVEQFIPNEAEAQRKVINFLIEGIKQGSFLDQKPKRKK